MFSWIGAGQAFTSVTGEDLLKDLHVTIAVLLVVHSCNVGYTPVIEAADAEVRAPALPGSHPARAGMGRQPGRLRERHAVRRARAVGGRAAEPKYFGRRGGRPG